MWCPLCQHDQPAQEGNLPASDRCPNCGTVLDADAPIFGAHHDDALVVPTQGDPRIWSTWELSEQLRHVERVLAVARPQHVTSKDGHHLRFDPPRQRTGPPVPAAAEAPRGRPLVGALVWIIVALGTVAFTCGAVLAGMGWNTQRAHLSNLGLPMVVGGQLALVIGLVVRVVDLGTRLTKRPTSVERELSLEMITSPLKQSR